MAFDTTGLGIPQSEEDKNRQEKFTATEVVIHNPLCNSCVYKDPNGPRCLAFPERIPLSILTGGVNHKNPYDGDNGIQYKKGKPGSFENADE